MSDETQNLEAEAEAEMAAAADAAEDMARDDAQNADQETGQDAGHDAGQENDPASEIAELKDKLLRSMADAENTRRIAARDKADAAKYAVTNFARDILRVADNLGFAMMSVSDEARQADKNLDNLYVGIDMTMKELLSVFEAHGIKPVPAEGQPFDHNIHEAVQQMENPDVPANTVMKVMRGGFTLQERLLRPAQVIVSTGGPKAEDSGEATKEGDAQGNDTAAPGGQKAYENGDQGTAHAVDQET